MIPKCGNCHGFVKNPKALNEGQCKGGPPAPLVIQSGAQVQVQFVWPAVRSDCDGCALHQDWADYVAARDAAPAPAPRPAETNNSRLIL